VLAHDHSELKGAEYAVFVDATRRYTDCTEAACWLLGYSRDEMLRKTIDDISYDIDEVPKLFAEYLKKGRLEGEYVLQSKNKIPVPIRYRAFVFSDGCNAAIWEPIKDWREPYLAALVEVHPAKLKQKLQIALAAVGLARESQNQSSQTPQERQSLKDAASALSALLKTVNLRNR
jgi:PAS domain-containing protein